MKKFVPLFLVLFTSIMMFSCGSGEEASKNEKPALNQSGPEYTSRYICPMHCPKSGSDKMGTCPVCKMDYVENKDFGKS